MSDRDLEDTLYQLLPPIYRTRDQQQGSPLRALMRVLQSQHDIVEANIQALYDAWFIETCPDWLVPYIGELVGVRGLDTSESACLPTQRARVANTLAYRARSGMSSVLGNAAGESSGWSAVAVEFFRAIAATQNLTAVDTARGGTVDVADRAALSRLDSPFNTIPHTANVTRVDQPATRGPYDAHNLFDLCNIGIFCWRLQGYPIDGVDACLTEGGYYTFHPLGIDTPLFTNAASRKNPADPLRADNVFAPVTPLMLEAWLAEARARPDAEQTLPFRIYHDPGCGRGRAAVSPRQMRTADLSRGVPKTVLSDHTAGSDQGEPHPIRVLIDPRLGRFVWLEDTTDSNGNDGSESGSADTAPASGSSAPAFSVDYVYGLSADLGGGPYSCIARLSEPDDDTWLGVVCASGDQGCFPSLSSAIDEWRKCGNGKDGLIRIADSATYLLKELEIRLDGSQLAIEALDGQRPCLVGDLSLRGNSERPTSVTLSGLLLQGTVAVSGRVHLLITDCTLWPPNGAPAVAQNAPVDDTNISGAYPNTRISIAYSIVGVILLPSQDTLLQVARSIIDGRGRVAVGPMRGPRSPTGYGPRTELTAVTVFGDMVVTALPTPKDSLITGSVTVQNLLDGVEHHTYADAVYSQSGQVRSFSPGQLPDDSPADAASSFYHGPRFVSRRYGDAAYAQLALSSGPAFLQGGSGNGELGVFHDLYQSRRRLDIDEVIADYMVRGLQAGVFYKT